MKSIKPTLGLLFTFGLVYAFTVLLAKPALADSDSMPAIIQAGFSAWVKNGVVLALDAWQKGGLMEGDRKIATQTEYFRSLDRALGNIKSFELLDSKNIGRAAEVLYIAINFERGVVYGRFLMFRSEKGWVVQNMDFSIKPEAIVPALAFERIGAAAE